MIGRRGQDSAPVVFVHNSQPAAMDPGAIRAAGTVESVQIA